MKQLNLAAVNEMRAGTPKSGTRPVPGTDSGLHRSKSKPSDHYYQTYNKIDTLIRSKHEEIVNKTVLKKRIPKRFGYFEETAEQSLKSTLRIETPSIKDVTYSTNRSTKTFLDYIPRQEQIKCPNWISLRENYCRQLEECIAVVIAAEDTTPEAIAKERTQFVALLYAIRTVTVNLVHSYTDLLKVSETVVPDSEHERNLLSLKRYLYNVCSSMNWLKTNGNPFNIWMGQVDTSMNPLFITHNLAGAPAFKEPFLSVPREENVSAEALIESVTNRYWVYNLDLVKRLPPPLQFTVKAFKELQAVSQVLHRVHSEWHQGLLDQQLKVHRSKTEELRSEKARDSTLSFLLFDHNDKARLESDFYSSSICHKFNIMSDAFRRWIRTYNNELKVKAKVNEKAHKTKQTIFNALVWFKWQCYRYRDMQIAQNNRIVFRCFDAWREYLIWCLAFNRLYERSIFNRKQFFLHKLKYYTMHNFHNRNFVEGVQHRRKKTTFWCLRRNVILNKYAIKMKLRNRTNHKSTTFYLRFIMAYCYWKWKRRLENLKALHAIKVLMERFTLRVHFWKLIPEEEPRVSLSAKLFSSSGKGGSSPSSRKQYYNPQDRDGGY